MAGPELVHFPLIDVEPDRVGKVPSERQGYGQSHIPEADDPDLFIQIHACSSCDQRSPFR
jgi:hypothetical protein